MIQKATIQNLGDLTELALMLWPDHGVEEMRESLAQGLSQENTAFFLFFVAECAVGFAQCQLRHDYVEGTDTSPVGYLEGIYVTEDARHRGIARELLDACESWAKAKGCSEFASDCELDNVQSMKFHRSVGFLEANRIICFTKKL